MILVTYKRSGIDLTHPGDRSRQILCVYRDYYNRRCSNENLGLVGTAFFPRAQTAKTVPKTTLILRTV